MRDDDEFMGLEDNEFTFGIDSDGHEYDAEDHIREYMMNGETNMMEDFEDLCDAAND